MPNVMTEEARELMEMTREFGEKRIAAYSAEYDLKGETPMDLYREAADLGYTSLAWPEELGGLGLSEATKVIIGEELSKYDAGFCNALDASTLASRPILLAGTEEQKQYAADIVIGGQMAAFALTEPNAGSDAAAITTTAIKTDDGYVINGRKCFITNGPNAQFYVVFAKTDKEAGVRGISAFLVERNRPGVSTGKHEDKMGIRLAMASDVIFDDVLIPHDHLLGQEGKGFKLAMQTMDIARVDCGAGALGIAQRAIDLAAQYAKERTTFGKPIAKLQAIQFKIADMEIRTQAARSLVWRCADMLDAGIADSKLCAASKIAASEAAMQNALDAVQIFGGYGYSREYPVEKLIRDAKIFSIFDGTNEILHSVVAGRMLK